MSRKADWRTHSMGAQSRFDRSLDALRTSVEPEYDIDPEADALRLARYGPDHYSWLELPEHVRDYWREEVAKNKATGFPPESPEEEE
jgi:hypothetical protein